MARLEDLKEGASVGGVLPNQAVTVIACQWHGDAVVTLVYKDQSGSLGQKLLYRHDESDLQVLTQGRPWSFDADGGLLRLVHERAVLGFEPRDVSRENLGYDVESKDPRTGRLRFIEVKGRVAGADRIIVTRNEMICALNSPDQWRLAIVMVEGVAGTPMYVVHPFTREPQFGETCAMFDLKALRTFEETGA